MDDGSSPHTKLIDARGRTKSPIGSGRTMSRQELAEAVNAWQWSRYERDDRLDETDIGKLERGEIRWPGRTRREGFRAVLGATTDAELGFFGARRNRALDTAVSVAQVPLPPPLMTSTALTLRGPGSPPAMENVLRTAGGQFFDGESIDTRTYPAVDDGRILAAVPADFAASRFLARARRGLVVGAIADDGGPFSGRPQALFEKRLSG